MESTSNMPLISIDINLFWQIINFFILIFVFNKFFKKPISKIIAERKLKIETSLNDATENQQKSKEAAEKAEKALTEAKQKAVEILRNAEYKADENREEVIKEAKERKEKILKDAELEVAKMEINKRKAIEKEVANLAIELAEKLIAKNIDKDNETTLINDFIEKIGEN